jgi:UDP:flavonoid glycosyltransferase YjiC (YdhE family)
LVIPFHSEQESNARRLAAAGAARVYLPVRDGASLVWHHWHGGSFSTLAYPRLDLSADGLETAILEAVADSELKANAGRLQREAARYLGPPAAVRLTEELTVAGSQANANGWKQLSWWQKLRLNWV